MIRSFRYLIFRILMAFYAIGDCIRGRALATNALLTPHETHRGTQSMDADAGVVSSVFNCLVTVGSDDRHFRLTNAAGDIPLGVILNDQVDAGEQGVIRKEIALFGLYHESLPAWSVGAIPALTDVVADPANPGYVMALPAAPGTYFTVGRARYTVPANGGQVSLIHCAARKITV